MKNKIHLRTIAKTTRKGLDIKTISQVLCEKLRQEESYKSAQHVMLFYPLAYEIDTLELLADKKSFYFPKVNGEDLFACPFVEDMEISNFGIKEPCSEPVAPDILDLIIVPALMVDKNGYRLGYGGGFYDRFLKKCHNAITVVLIPKELYINELPCEDFDVKIDKIITF